MILNIKDSIAVIKTENKKYFYFTCDKCFSQFKVESNNLYRRKTKSCQKCSSLVGLQKVNIKPLYYGLYTKCKNSAKKKDIFFDLTFEEFKFFTKIHNCIYCDSLIDWNTSKDRYNLDRKDNSIGYIKNNLVVCCWFCNNLKSNLLNYEEFILFKPILIKIINDRKRKINK